MSWPKIVIPNKSYSLSMLYIHHTKYFIMHNPDDKPSNCFILLMFSSFSTFTQYMSVSHGYNTIGGIEYDGGGCVEKIKKRKSHIDAANQWAMEMPINFCQCK